MSRLMSLFSKKEPVDPDLPVPDVDTSLPPELAGVYQAKPSWIIREITKEEAKALARELRSASARTAIEIGVASGFSSAVILSCMRRNSAGAKLYAFDLADMTKTTREATIRAKDRDLAGLLNPDPNDQVYKNKPLAFTAEINRRLTEWMRARTPVSSVAFARA